MADIKDGGPAFPVHERHAVLRESGWRDEWLAVGGMSLRDWFAGQALTGVVADWGETAFMPDVMANRAYRLADAMLRVREAK